MEHTEGAYRLACSINNPNQQTNKSVRRWLAVRAFASSLDSFDGIKKIESLCLEKIVDDFYVKIPPLNFGVGV
jgi:hypothetical protein